MRVRRAWTLFAACIDSGRGMSDVGTRADYDREKKGSRSPLFMSSILNCPALITRPFDSRLPPRPTSLSFDLYISRPLWTGLDKCPRRVQRGQFGYEYKGEMRLNHQSKRRPCTSSGLSQSVIDIDIVDLFLTRSLSVSRACACTGTV
ncbi:hypothetical protein JB92DRAFT_1962060 [Gautieria morchelliformis]|nr:hypothetical protein JB92DRAFT_1962060 [Gautieria morchelliformis]